MNFLLILCKTSKKEVLKCQSLQIVRTAQKRNSETPVGSMDSDALHSEPSHSVLPQLCPSLHLELPSSVVKALAFLYLFIGSVLHYTPNSSRITTRIHCQQQTCEAKFQILCTFICFYRINRLGVCS